VPSWWLVTGLFAAFLLALVTLVIVVYALVKMPDLNDLSLPTATVYEYSDGTPFYTDGLVDRVIISADQIPPVVAHAVVAIENPTFFTDEGIALQGGSTITQQFVKNAYLTQAQTFGRKFSEMVLAVKITQAYSKAQILDDYFNTAYFGRGSYGLQAAAETYFGVSAQAITSPGQAAYLAALVNEPTVLSQSDPADQALLRGRWNSVLNDMVTYGYLTSSERATVRWPAALPPSGAIALDKNGVDESAMAQVADDYLDQVHAADPQVPDAATAEAGGDVIVSTFTRAAMTAAVRAVRDQLYDRLRPGDRSQAAADRGVQVGVATVDSRTGELLGFYPGLSDDNNATQAQIEPGSQMEAFAQVALFARSDKPDASPLWGLMGKIGLTRNLIAYPAELPEPLAKLKKDPELALGIAPESPARIAAAYAIFTDGGVFHDLAMIRSVAVDGHRVWSYTPTSTTLLPPAIAGTLGKMVGLKPSYAGTRGTIGDDDSAWFTGYVGPIVTAVGLWDQTINARHILVKQTLNGLGGVTADRTDVWPAAIWNADMAAISPAGTRFPALAVPG
jgi:membrane peptidoglycan carboxypeptidase